jgi:hypothetical protein
MILFPSFRDGQSIDRPTATQKCNQILSSYIGSLSPPPFRRRRRIGWIWFLHDDSDKDEGDNYSVSNFLSMMIWRLKFPNNDTRQLAAAMELFGLFFVFLWLDLITMKD